MRAIGTVTRPRPGARRVFHVYLPKHPGSLALGLCFGALLLVELTEISEVNVAWALLGYTFLRYVHILRQLIVAAMSQNTQCQAKYRFHPPR